MWDLTYLCNYNNYIRRQLRRHNTKQAYKNASTKYYEINDSTLFNPGDGVDTRVIANFEINIPALEVDEPDYLIVCDDDGDIKQRWFVIDCDRTRAGQYQVHLHRDVLAETWDTIKGQNAYIEKGIPLDTNTAIYNREDMTYNQILRSQTPLKDVTGCAWIVGYMTQDNIKYSKNYLKDFDYEVEKLSDYIYYNYTAGGDKLPIQINGDRKYRISISNGQSVDGSTLFELYYYATPQRWGFQFIDNQPSSSSPLFKNTDTEDVRNAFGNLISSQRLLIEEGVKRTVGVEEDFLSQEVGKIIKVGTDNPEFYEISAIDTVQEYYSNIHTPEHSEAFKAFENAVGYARLSNEFLTTSSYGDSSSYTYTVQATCRQLILTSVTFANETTYTVSNERKRLKDQPYSMFAMPYGSTTITGWSGTQPSDFKEISMNVARSLSSKYSGGDNPILFDLQLLPYCPMRDMFQNNHINLSRGTAGVDYQYVKQGSTNVGIIFWAEKSIFSFDIPYTFTVFDKKIVNETYKLRLISPNFDGVFEFNPAKLYGNISQIDVDCAYKPYKPYIHLNPPFGNLYGVDTDDARGLICGGDFSLPQTSDAWELYERNNANYSRQFNRQIENLEINQNIAKQKEVIGVGMGFVEGAAQGAINGSAVPYGALAGGIAGGVGSLATGLQDIYYNDKLRAETMDYTKDMYAMSMQNIQALPAALINIGAYNQNNKLFPCIETYYPEDDEFEALYNKINYNGMTVNRIGKITDYLHSWSQGNGWTYIKGTLVRPVVSNTDYHYLRTVQEELNRGIFVEVS